MNSKILYSISALLQPPDSYSRFRPKNWSCDWKLFLSLCLSTPWSDCRCRLDRLEIISTVRWNLEHFPVLFFVSRGSEINTYLYNTLYIFSIPYLLLLYNIVAIIFSGLLMSFWFFKNINQMLAFLCLKFFIGFLLHWVKKHILFLSPRTCMMHHPLFVEWIQELGRDIMINIPHIVALVEE